MLEPSTTNPVPASLTMTLLLAGCATSPTGRSQLHFFSETKGVRLGDKACEQTLSETPAVWDFTLASDVRCVVDALNAARPCPPPGGGSRQATVFREKTGSLRNWQQQMPADPEFHRQTRVLARSPACSPARTERHKALTEIIAMSSR